MRAGALEPRVDALEPPVFRESPFEKRPTPGPRQPEPALVGERVGDDGQRDDDAQAEIARDAPGTRLPAETCRPQPARRGTAARSRITEFVFNHRRAPGIRSWHRSCSVCNPVPSRRARKWRELLRVPGGRATCLQLCRMAAIAVAWGVNEDSTIDSGGSPAGAVRAQVPRRGRDRGHVHAAGARPDAAPVRPGTGRPRDREQRRRRLDSPRPEAADILARRATSSSASTAGSTCPRSRPARSRSVNPTCRRTYAALVAYAANGAPGEAAPGRRVRRRRAIRAGGDGPAVKAAVKGVVALGLPDLNELGWRWKDAIIYITKGVPDEPTFSVETLIDRVAPLPLAALHSTRDEFVPVPAITRLMDLPRAEAPLGDPGLEPSRSRGARRNSSGVCSRRSPGSRLVAP